MLWPLCLMFLFQTNIGIANPIIPDLPPDNPNIQNRFKPPSDFNRTLAKGNSFAHYLRNLKLKPDGSKVLLYDGREKQNYGVYLAVVDLPIGSKNLHQCADAVIRLRAEYLFFQKKYSKITFHFTNGFAADYTKWMQGNRIVVSGNTCKWEKRTNPSNNYETFWKYLETVFSYAGTLSLSKELTKREWEKMEIGDVLIQGGSPGHAVIVVDMVINPKTGEKQFMLAQSYMPAQEIQILTNPEKPAQPWYTLSSFGKIKTPEWNFSTVDLKCFND